MYYLLSGLLMVLCTQHEEVYTNIKDSISDVLENSNEFDFSENK